MQILQNKMAQEAKHTGDQVIIRVLRQIVFVREERPHTLITNSEYECNRS